MNEYAAWSDLDEALPDVRIGGYEYSGGRYERRAAIQAVVHENYNAASLDNDIALLLLDRPATAEPVLLPASSEWGLAAVVAYHGAAWREHKGSSCRKHHATRMVTDRPPCGGSIGAGMPAVRLPMAKPAAWALPLWIGSAAA